MTALAPIPSNEKTRLDVLHSYFILDTPAEERCDFFTRLGTWLFDVPLCAINLVDADRTFFKSLIGLSPYEPKRRTSICAHAVAAGEPVMVIENLAEDSRFCDHPLVTTKEVKFYAGALLYSDEGHVLGTFCIGDVKPRSFSGDQRSRLADLAKGVVAVLDLHRAGMRMLKAATEDTLTGLDNRRAFGQTLESAIGQARADAPCAVLCLDLDRFKAVNDRFGHAGGDALLCEVARRLSRTADEAHTVARLGGDEFVIVMRRVSGVDVVLAFAARLLAALAEPFLFEGEPIPIGTSIGIALYPNHADDAASLLRRADLALYKAKQDGRGRFSLFGEPDRAA